MRFKLINNGFLNKLINNIAKANRSKVLASYQMFNLRDQRDFLSLKEVTSPLWFKISRNVLTIFGP